MNDGSVLIINEREITSILAGREQEVMQTIELAYLAHHNQQSTLPHSSFLTFPDSNINRIIALPAYLGEGFDTAGIKWISSFPGNREFGMNRASAVIILNSMTTGRANAVMEGSVISAKRTAASAVIAAQRLSRPQTSHRIGFIGCGLINLEVLRFLVAAYPSIKSIALYDHTAERAEQFVSACQDLLPNSDITVCTNSDVVLAEADIVSFATTAVHPHIQRLPARPKGQVILHVSLRDLSPEIILEADNIVDDVDHVCRANTSIHLAEQLAKNRSFIRGTIADIITGQVPAKSDQDNVTIFSPFGLGVLDLALATVVHARAHELGLGITVESFFG